MEIPLYFLIIVLSGLLTYFIQKIFVYFKRFDDFNFRSSHKTLATRTGGISVFLTLLSVALYFYFNAIELYDYSLFIPLGIMFVVGVYDDFYNADFKLKFLLQIIVAKIIIDQGYAITNFHGLFGLYDVPWILAQLSTVFVFLVIINATNFIDGIDGLAITEVIKTILFIQFLSDSSYELITFSTMVVTSLIPLYYFNFKKKQKVFLGDGGSLLLGTIISISVFSVLGDKYHFKEGFEINKVLFTVLILMYPLVDLLRVFVIRIMKGESPFSADQRHIHHILFKFFKFSHLKTTTTIIFLEAIIIFAAFYVF